MEVSWLYAWATFLFIAIFNRPFPLPEAAGTFALAAALTFFSRGRGWLVIQTLGLQVLGFALAGLRILYVFHHPPTPFFGFSWLVPFLRSPRAPMEWFLFAMVLFWALSFWVGGVTLARRSRTYHAVCSRFDLGLAFFFLLYLTKFLLFVKGGIAVEASISELLLLPFFVFGLLAIGLVRNQGYGRKDFLSGCHGIGVILSFTVVILWFGTGMVLFFMPTLIRAAEVGYDVLRVVAAPLGQVLMGILRFLYMPRRFREDAPSAMTGNHGPVLDQSAEEGWWSDLLREMLGWGLFGLMGLIFLGLAALAGWFLLRWLFSRTPKGRMKKPFFNPVSLWLAGLRAFLSYCRLRIILWVKGYGAAVQLYGALLGWGRRSGMPHVPSETSIEYGVRLKGQFPRLEGEIESLIRAFNQEVYGQEVLGERQLALAKGAWRRLRHPLHWPSRLRSWFLQPGPE
ncbi:MAG: DUF4129 domain-containing protein [Pseudomonadota bacterium]